MKILPKLKKVVRNLQVKVLPRFKRAEPQHKISRRSLQRRKGQTTRVFPLLLKVLLFHYFWYPSFLEVNAKRLFSRNFSNLKMLIRFINQLFIQERIKEFSSNQQHRFKTHRHNLLDKPARSVEIKHRHHQVQLVNRRLKLILNQK